MKSPQSLDLLLSIDRLCGVPIRTQLEEQLRRAIREQRLHAGLQLPATRTLASEIGLSRGLVVEAYEQLLAEGWIVSRRGSGTRVASRGVGIAVAEVSSQQQGDLPRFDFRPGSPDPQRFPWSAWTAAVRRGMAAAGADAFRYPDHRGAPVLRASLARYLARARGCDSAAERLLVCGGFTQAMDLICRVLKERGARCIAIEDPAFESLGTNINAHGLVTHRIAVDDHGMQVDRLRATAADAVVVTPAHQYPTGAVLSPLRRERLLAWARERGALIIEDDYDAEFRYDGPACGALQGQASEHTLYVGTASKTLTPALRLGWILAPAPMATALAALKRRVDRGASAIEQIALAGFIEHGDLDRHLRRMRVIYRRRRDAVLAALARHRFEHRVHGISAGLHLMIELSRDVDEFELVRQAQLQSVRLFAGRGFWSQPQAAPPALVLGYGAIELEDIDEGIARLACIVREGVPAVAALRA